jgi:hypothetical protein
VWLRECWLDGFTRMVWGRGRKRDAAWAARRDAGYRAWAEHEERERRAG